MNSAIILSNFEIHDVRSTWGKLEKLVRTKRIYQIQVTYKD